MGYEKLCKNILELDTKIRFAGVVNSQGILINNMNQAGVEEEMRILINP